MLFFVYPYSTKSIEPYSLCNYTHHTFGETTESAQHNLAHRCNCWNQINCTTHEDQHNKNV